MRLKMVLFAVLGAMSILCGGCAVIGNSTPENQSVVPYYGGKGVVPFRRVILLPLDAERAMPEQVTLLGRSIQAAVTKRNLFEVIPVSKQDLKDINIDSTRRRGVYETRDLLILGERFGADGVLHGTVTAFESFPEMRLGLRLYMLDCRRGRAPWATDVMFDASERVVVQDVHNYHDTVLTDRESLVGHRTILLSPRLFSGYAAHRVVSTLEETLTGKSDRK